jgi:L-lysine exporter family protein LysE/ArgO
MTDLAKSASTGFLLSLSLCLDLGIVNVAVLRTVATQGGAAGFLLGVGSCAGDLVYLACAVLGAAALFQWRPVRLALWLIGTCVLLFLAWRMFHEMIHPKNPDLAKTPPAHRKLFATGFGLALASPSAILWFAAIGGSVAASLGGDRTSLWEFCAGFFAAGITWSAGFAWGAAELMRITGGRLVQAMAFVSALLFLCLAAVVFVQGVRQFA